MCHDCNSKDHQKAVLQAILEKHKALIDNLFYTRASLQTSSESRERFNAAFEARLKAFDKDYQRIVGSDARTLVLDGYSNQIATSLGDSEKLKQIENEYALIHSAVYNDRAHFGKNPKDFLERHTVLEVADAATHLYQSFSRLVKKILEFLDERAKAHGVK